MRIASNTSVDDAQSIVSGIASPTKFNVTLPITDKVPEENDITTTHTVGMLSIFYFHPDHLCNSSYITNSAGVVSQHMEYLPFGETLTDEHLNSTNSPFKFNGKERDEETGNYYYSARYYDPKLSIFISVDPLADKYPGINPYAYCFNNPIKFIDPDGKAPLPVIVDPIQQYNLNKFKTVENVLSGKAWIDYRDVGNCGTAARMQNRQVKGADPTYDGQQVNMYIDKINSRQINQDKIDGKPTTPINIQKGLDVISKNLNDGKPVMVGVMDTHTYTPGNDNVATNHYINVVGSGYENGTLYLSYYDNYTTSNLSEATYTERMQKGTDIKENRLYWNSKGNYFYDNTKLSVQDPNHDNNDIKNFILTEVKDNQ